MDPSEDKSRPKQSDDKERTMKVAIFCILYVAVFVSSFWHYSVDVYIGLSTSLLIILGIALIYTPDLIRFELMINVLFAIHILLQLTHAATVAEGNWITTSLAASSIAAHTLKYLSTNNRRELRWLSFLLNILVVSFATTQIVLNKSHVHIASAVIGYIIALYGLFLFFRPSNKTFKTKEFAPNTRISFRSRLVVR